MRICRADRTIIRAMSQPQTKKNKNTSAQFWAVWFIITAIAFGAAGFWAWQYWTLASENERFETSIANTSERLKELQPGSFELNRKRSEVAKRADEGRVMWSQTMAQALKLETDSARFADLQIDGREVSATVQAASWAALSEFTDSLKKNDAVRDVRVSKTAVLEEAIAGATQEAKITFLFSPTEK